MPFHRLHSRIVLMADIFLIKQGATLPRFTNYFTSNGDPIVLTGSGILTMTHQFGHSFSRAYSFLDQSVDENTGRIYIDWTPEDIADWQLGIYYVEQRHTFTGGSVAVFPTDAEVLFDRIQVLPALE